MLGELTRMASEWCIFCTCKVFDFWYICLAILCLVFLLSDVVELIISEAPHEFEKIPEFHFSNLHQFFCRSPTLVMVNNLLDESCDNSFTF